MAPLTVYLISLKSQTGVREFLQTLQQPGSRPLLLARVIQWIIVPSTAEHLLQHEWDFLIVDTSLPPALLPLSESIYLIRFEQNNDMLLDILQNNQKHLHPSKVEPVFNLEKPILSTSTQDVKLTPALLAFAKSSLCPPGPVSMLNFIAFHPYEHAKKSYSNYIDGFKASVGSKRGGILKVHGETTEMGVWDQVALAQYPSLLHFADMAADPDYQSLNEKHRLPALRDTCILMTSEVQLDWTGS